jgi:hypothetical protein
MSTRTRVALVVVLVLVAGAAGVWAYGSRTPPPLEDHRVGVVRLSPRLGIPPIPNKKVTLADGTSVLLSVFRITDEGGAARAEIGVRRLPGGTAEYVGLTQGQHHIAQGVDVELLHVWVMPAAAHSAADVRVTPVVMQ